ncbi:MAG: tetratricopeptide repeat protein [Anaerolineae bacterium]|nr:tetratricopeptide repeat protein [Anaerolineae bacterium]
MDKWLREIDEALNSGDLKRSELIIARQLRAHKGASERAGLLLRRASVRLMGARPDDAFEDLETAVALQPEQENSPSVRTLRADVHLARFELAPVGFADRADTDAALVDYQYILKHAPTYERRAWVHYQMGRIHLSQHEIEAAVQDFRAALESPSQPPQVHALSHERLGFIALYDQRQPRQALEAFQRAVQAHSGNEEIGWLTQLYLQISRAHLELSEHQRALSAAQKALQAIQSGTTTAHRNLLPEAHMALGDILALRDGAEAEAIKHYLRFLQSSKRPPGIDVTWSQVHENIGDLSFRIERYQEAINAYEKALEYNPYHPWEVKLHYQIARCHYRMRAFEKAVEAIQRMKHLAAQEHANITDWRVATLLGNAYFALEQYPAAAEAYREAIALAPPGASELERTEIYLRFAEELARSPH